MSEKPVYFLRLNQDASLVSPVRHVEMVSDTEVMIRDKASFPPGSWPEGGVKVVLFELLDGEGNLWAMRRLPPSVNLVLTNAFRFVIDWKLTIIEEDGAVRIDSNG